MESGVAWNRLLPLALRTQLARRAFTEAPRERVSCVPLREIVRLGAGPLLLKDVLCSGERPFSIIGMYRHFDGKLARRVRTGHPDAVYAYEGGALKTFREARRRELRRFTNNQQLLVLGAQACCRKKRSATPNLPELLPNL